MSQAMPLFENVQAVPLSGPAIPREQAIKAAMANAGSKFIEEYTAFALLYAASHEDFIGEDITREWMRQKRPCPREWRAVGGIFQGLVKRGIFEKTHEYRSRENGSPSAVYRLKRQEG